MVEVTGRAVPVSGLNSDLEKIQANRIPVFTVGRFSSRRLILLCFKVAKQY
jgi:hypothetical protein